MTWLGRTNRALGLLGLLLVRVDCYDAAERYRGSAYQLTSRRGFALVDRYRRDRTQA